MKDQYRSLRDYSSKLIEQDKLMKKIQKEINTKERFMEEKKEAIERTKNMNRFLESVHQDYMDYNRKIEDERRDKENALRELHAHIEDIKRVDRAIDEHGKQLAQDQEIILTELKKVRQRVNQEIR